MFKEIFNKKKVLEKTNTHEQDMALRLMFEIAISDGSLDKKELELIKKRAVGGVVTSYIIWMIHKLSVERYRGFHSLNHKLV